MTDLLRDAENELRREKMEKTAKFAIPIVIATIVIVVLIGLGLQFWRTQHLKSVEKTSDEYYEAMAKLQAGDLDGGIRELTEVAKHGSGLGNLALIQIGDVQEEKGDYAAALKSYDEAAKTISNKDLKDLARLRGAYAATFVENDAQVIKRADEIIKSDSGFALLARELKAGALWSSGKAADAKKEYELLQLDPNAPKGLQARAQQAVAVINSGAAPAKDLAKLPEQGQQAGQEQAAAQAAQAQAAQAGAPNGQNVEYDKDGKRIVRLPPGVKLPAGTKVPDDVRVIETPLPAGAQKAQAQQLEAAKKAQADAQAKAKADMMKEVQAQRNKAMKEQESVTKAQQKQINEINKGAGAATPATDQK